MGNYKFLRQYLWFGKQMYFLYFLFSVRSIVLPLQIDCTNTYENLVRTNAPVITQLLTTQSNCSKQQHETIKLKPVQKGTQAPSGNGKTQKIASAFVRTKTKTVEAFRCSANFLQIAVSFTLMMHTETLQTWS